MNLGIPALPKRPSNNKDALFRAVVRATVVNSNTAAATAQGFSFWLNYPTYYRNPAGTNVQAAIVATSFPNEQKLYDEYRVVGLRVSYLPVYQPAAASTSAAPFDPTMVVLSDDDDSALLVSTAKALNSQNGSFAVRSIEGQGSPFIIAHQRQTDAFNSLKWLNTQSPTPTSPDVTNPAQAASVKVYCLGYPAMNISAGTFILEWDVVFRGVYSGQ
jgi:hypothetical protein